MEHSEQRPGPAILGVPWPLALWQGACPSYLLPAHPGQLVQVNVDEVELHSVWRLTLRMQDLLHQDVEEKLDTAKGKTHTALQPPLPTSSLSPERTRHSCAQLLNKQRTVEKVQQSLK